MRTRSDTELLNEYAANQSEAAFGEIVRRYADTVYSAALRQVGSDAQARDVAQIVFFDLARKAASLNANTLLIGWLHRGARLAALELLRKEQRRDRRERQAMEFHDPAPESDNWNDVRPVLDEAIANLGEEDRAALLLRFFQNESLASVGTTLGVSEGAAQKRVSRALGKLRDFLEQRGIKTTAAALSAVLTANAVRSAPANFAASLTAGTLAKAALAGSSTTPVLKVLTFTNMKTAILILTLAGGLAGITLVRVQSQHRLRETQALAQQQAEEIEALRAANEQLANQTNELARLRSEAREVLSLRGEVTQLRRTVADRKALVPQMAPLETNVPSVSPESQINVRAKFVTVPEGYISAEATGLLTDSQFRTVLKALQQVEGTVSLSDLQVTTLSGRQAQVSSVESISLVDGITNTGPVLEVIPVYATNSHTIQLELTAELRELIDMSPQRDSSQPGIQFTATTNSVSVWDGQTVMLYRKIPDRGRRLSGASANMVAGPRGLVVFVTPTIIDSAGNRRFTDEEVSAGQSTNAPFAGPVVPQKE